EPNEVKRRYLYIYGVTPESHAPAPGRIGAPRCRMRDDPTARGNRNGADAGGGGLSRRPRGYGRAAEGSSVGAATSDREPGQGRQRRVRVGLSRHLPLRLYRWREGVFRVRASQGAEGDRSARGRKLTVRRRTRRGAVSSAAADTSHSKGRSNRSRC